MDNRSDENLVAESCRGDKAAYAALVGRYAKRVFAICLGILGNAHDAEDIAQDTLVKGFLQIHTLRDLREFSGWLTRIARNGCMDFLRRTKQNDNFLKNTRTVSQPENQQHPELQLALRQLPEELRLPLLLYYFDGQSTKSVAEVLNITEAGVHTRISRARKELRRILTKKGVES